MMRRVPDALRLMMDQGSVGTPPAGAALKLLPLVSILAFMALALSMAAAYGEDAIYWPICHAVPGGTVCPSAQGMWLSLAISWALVAAGLAALMGAEVHLNRGHRGLRIPPFAVLVAGLGLLAFGLAALWVAGQGSYGRVPRALGDVMYVSYLTAALGLLAVAFVDYRPASSAVEKWAIVLASAHGLVGLGLGYIWAYIALEAWKGIATAVLLAGEA